MQYTVKHVFTAAAMIFIMLAVTLAPALISPAADIAYGKTEAKASIKVTKPAKVNLDVKDSGRLKVKKKVSGASKSKDCYFNGG